MDLSETAEIATSGRNKIGYRCSQISRDLDQPNLDIEGSACLNMFECAYMPTRLEKMSWETRLTVTSMVQR